MKKEIELDELHIKCLNEMPLIVDVLSSTTNRVCEILSVFNKQATLIVEENLKIGWNIQKNDNETFGPTIFPLMHYDITEKKIGVGTGASACFAIRSQISIVKEVEKKNVNFFSVGLGYYCYDNYDIKFDNSFSFYIFKHSIKPKYGGIINDLKFYEDIKNSLSNYKININHEDNGDNKEMIELYFRDFSKENLLETFSTFKESILIPFLKNLP
jgi:hypothetical protein